MTPWSIRSQVVALVAAVTIPLAALGVYAFWSETRLGARLAEQATLDVADVTAASIAQSLADARTTLSGMAARPSIRSMAPGPCRGFLAEANRVLTQYWNLVLTRVDGTLVCSALPPSETDLPGHDPDWPTGAAERPVLHVGKPARDPVSGRWSVVLATAVHDSTGATTGHVAAFVDLERFQRLLMSVDLPEDGVVTLAHSDGTLVARSAGGPGLIGERLPRVEGGGTHAARGRGIQLARGIEGVDRVWGYRRVAGSDWMVYAGLPTSWVYGGVWRRAATKALPGVGILALLTLLATTLYLRIDRALASLIDGVRDAARGGRPSIPTDGPPELAAVAQEFNRTLADRDRAVQALSRSRRRYRSIMDNAVFGIFVATPDGKLLEANPALARILGYDGADDLLEAPLGRFYPDAHDRLVAAAAQGPSSGTQEAEWIRADGRPVAVRLHWSAIDDPEGGAAFEVLAEDLTERKALEEQFRQAQKLEAVGRLAGGVAHDFNNRLTVIQGEAQLLLVDLEDDSPLRSSVEAILRSTERATTLTRQLLAFGRKRLTRPRPLDLNEVVAGVAEVLERVVGEDVRVVVELVHGGAPVHADPGDVEQILLNLCTNARDAMPGGGTLTLRTSLRSLGQMHAGPGPATGAWAVLTVGDSGTGMDPDTQERLFEPFFTTKPPGEGSGLGLSTVYGLVLQAGGHLAVSSSPGEGSVFDVWLPLMETDLAAPGWPTPRPLRDREAPGTTAAPD